MIEPTEELGTPTRRDAFGGQPNATSDASDLGDLLFERRRNGPFWVAVVVTAISGVAGTVMLFYWDRVPFVPFTMAVLSFAVISLLVAVATRRFRFRCYQSGLAFRHIRNEYRLRFDEITEVHYLIHLVDKAGLPAVGGDVDVTFRGPRGTIRYVYTPGGKLDRDIEKLRDQISKMIAHRMIDDLRAGRAVPWVRDVVFLPKGLQFQRSKMLGLARGPVEVLPYGQIRCVSLQNFFFEIYSRAEAKPVLVVSSMFPNSYPGYFVVLTLLAGGAQESTG